MLWVGGHTGHHLQVKPERSHQHQLLHYVSEFRQAHGFSCSLACSTN
jgi:hypothetical protein